MLDWLSTAVAFPATVVDRIVPATTDADRDAAAAALGVRDDMAVVGEPYRQWVLEDSFTGPRPPWELDGALFVADVAPYQLMKLRLLNGSHSALAYLGLAAGCSSITEVLHTGWGERLVRQLAAEVGPTLPDVGSGRGQVHRRPGRPVQQPGHARSAAPHRLRRIAQDRRALARGARERSAPTTRPPRSWNSRWPAGSTPPAPPTPAGSSSAPPTRPRQPSPHCWRNHRRTRRHWSPHCCARSAPPTSPTTTT